MSTKTILFLCVALFAVALSVPTTPAPKEADAANGAAPKENMKGAETIYRRYWTPSAYSSLGYHSAYYPLAYRSAYPYYSSEYDMESPAYYTGWPTYM